MPFYFEDLAVYKLSLKWVAVSNSISFDSNVRVRKTLHDQLSRATLSIPLNIAEGSGRFHNNERRQYFRIARGSIFECVAIIQVLKELKMLDGMCFEDCYKILDELSRMVSGLIKSVDV